MPKNTQGALASGKKLTDLVRPFAIRVATINGVLAVVGVAVALYVYLAFAIPTKIDHDSVGRFGQPIEPENAITYLFAFACFQIWFALVPLLGTRRSDHQTSDQQAHQIARLQTFLSWITPAPDTVGLRKGVLMALVFAEALMLSATIYHSAVTALSSA